MNKRVIGALLASLMLCMNAHGSQEVVPDVGVAGQQQLYAVGLPSRKQCSKNFSAACSNAKRFFLKAAEKGYLAAYPYLYLANYNIDDDDYLGSKQEIADEIILMKCILKNLGVGIALFNYSSLELESHGNRSSRLLMESNKYSIFNGLCEAESTCILCDYFEPIVWIDPITNDIISNEKDCERLLSEAKKFVDSLAALTQSVDEITQNFDANIKLQTDESLICAKRLYSEFDEDLLLMINALVDKCLVKDPTNKEANLMLAMLLKRPAIQLVNKLPREEAKEKSHDLFVTYGSADYDTIRHSAILNQDWK